jgi:hypothetical protein
MWGLSFWGFWLLLDLPWLQSRGSFGIRVHSKALVAIDKMSPGSALDGSDVFPIADYGDKGRRQQGSFC